MSKYNQRQNRVARWDQRLRDFRKKRTSLKTLQLKGKSGTLIASPKGCVSGMDTNYLGRIYLNNELSYEIVNEYDPLGETSDWLVSYETESPSSLLQANHHFTVPNTLDGKDVSGLVLYIQVYAHLNGFCFTAPPGAFDPKISLSIIKNDIDTIAVASAGTVNDGDDIFFESMTINVFDIIPCRAGDTLDLYITTSDQMKFYTGEGSEQVFAVFSVVHVEKLIPI